MTFSIVFQVSTGAYERLVFTVPGGNPLKDRREINRITWASWTRRVTCLVVLLVVLLCCSFLRAITVTLLSLTLLPPQANIKSFCARISLTLLVL